MQVIYIPPPTESGYKRLINDDRMEANDFYCLQYN